jgi:hypothetical protein
VKKASLVVLLLVAAMVLGATVLREPVASAAQAILPVNIVGPVDANGNVKVHEQGTANVNVTNSSLSVAPKLPANAFSEWGFDDETVGPSNLPAGTTWYISELSGGDCGGSPQEVAVVLEGGGQQLRGDRP